MRMLKLNVKLRDAFNLWVVFTSIEEEIEEMILKELPLKVCGKINSIGIDTDYDDFIILRVNVNTRDLKIVEKALKEYYPRFKWVANRAQNVSDVSVILTSDILTMLPFELFKAELIEE